MKKESPEKIGRDIAESHELLKRSKALLSELDETVQRSRTLLEQSYRLIDKLKTWSPYRNDSER